MIIDECLGGKIMRTIREIIILKDKMLVTFEGKV